MNNNIDLLVKLQKTDAACDRLTRKLENGPQRIKEIENKIISFQQALEVEKQRYDDTRKNQRKLEMEVEEGEDQIRKSKSRLVTIKTNKEYFSWSEDKNWHPSREFNDNRIRNLGNNISNRADWP